MCYTPTLPLSAVCTVVDQVVTDVHGCHMLCRKQLESEQHTGTNKHYAFHPDCLTLVVFCVQVVMLATAQVQC